MIHVLETFILSNWKQRSKNLYILNTEFKSSDTLHVYNMYLDSVFMILSFFEKGWITFSFFLHLHEIVEGLYFHSSLSVCVCLCVRISCEQNSMRTDASIWTRFSLNGCLLHWLRPYWNWWPWVKGQGHSDIKCV